MREILFRGKTQDGKWVQGDFCKPCNIVYETVGYDEALKQENAIVWNDEKVMSETVGQYTGLCDKNGTKIFEGDVIKMTFEEDYAKEANVEEFVEYLIVKWNDEDFCFECRDTRIFAYCCLSACSTGEVIGNVHDNPKWLEGKRK